MSTARKAALTVALAALILAGGAVTWRLSRGAPPTAPQAGPLISPQVSPLVSPQVIVPQASALVTPQIAPAGVQGTAGVPPKQEPGTMKVLQGVPKIGYRIRLCPFPGSVESVMKYLNEPVDYDTIMGVTGACFRRTYNRDDGGNVDLLYFSPEPQRRIFEALGYEFRAVSWRDKSEMVAAIKESVAAGKPVIACGIIGPPEAGIVVGYDQDGEVLLGYSYFQDGKKFPGYYEQPDWYEVYRRQREHPTAPDANLGPKGEEVGLMVLGQKKAKPTDREVLVSTLKWAIDLARVSKRSHLPDHVCGLAAYDAWANGLEVDADYPKDRPKTLETRAMAYSDQATMLWERSHAVRFLRKMAAVAPEAAAELEAAVAEYENVGRVKGLWPWRSHWFMDAEVQQGLADPATRRALAAGIRECRDFEAKAIEHLEKALAVLSPLPAQASLKTPTKEELTRGARWQVENMPNAIALRAAMNVLGVDLGKEVNKDGWSTDHAYDLAMVAAGDAFGFCMSMRKNDGKLADTFRRNPAAVDENAYCRMFEVAGYSGEVLMRPDPGAAAPAFTEAAVRARIVNSIAREGRPVIVQGLPSPGFVALITGYEKSGEVLQGWSCEGGGPSILFEPAKRQTFTDWFAHTDGVVIVKERVGRDDGRVHRRMLAQAVQFLRRNEADGYLAGGALFEAWARAFADASDEADAAATLKRYNALIDPYIWDLAERRHYARVVLELIAPLLPAGAEELHAAATEFAAIHDLMWKINRTGGGGNPGGQLPKLTDPAVRKEIAGIIREAAAHDIQAAALIEKALAKAFPVTPQLKRDGGKVWLEGVDTYRAIDPLYEGVRTALTARGEKYSSDYIQGLSGSAFRIGGICPCAPTCANWLRIEKLLELLGYESEKITPKDEKDEETIVKVIERVRQEVDAGRVALVFHAFTTVEFDIVFGYDTEKRQFLGRGSYAGNDKPYAAADERRMSTCGKICPIGGALLIGRKTGTLDARAAELAALREAVTHAHRRPDPKEEADGKWHMYYGLACYDRWIADFDKHPQKPPNGSQYCFGVIRSTHRAAAGFLREIAPRHPQAGELLRRAAECFATEADALDGGAEVLWWKAPKQLGPEHDDQAAKVLRQAREQYAKGIECIEQALVVVDAKPH